MRAKTFKNEKTMEGGNPLHELVILPNDIIGNEYFCHNCQQLRLNLANRKTCGNCGSGHLTFGKIGSLDKKSLAI